MDRTTDAIWLRYAYHVVAREKGRQLDSHLVSELTPVKFKVVDPSETEPVATLVRPARYRYLDRRATRPDEPDQTVEFRSVEGTLMRPVMDANGDPIKVVDVEAHARGRPDWIDYPSPPLAVGQSRNLWAPQGQRDRATSGLKDFGAGGREGALAAMTILNGSMRAVDGVLWRPTSPPCWRLEPTRNGDWRVCACVLDLDHPDVAARFRNGALHCHVVDGRIDVDALLAELDREPRKRGAKRSVAEGSLSFEFPNPPSDPDLAEANLWILRENMDCVFGSVKWNDLSPPLKATMALIEVAVGEALEGRVGLDVATADVRKRTERMAAGVEDPQDWRPGAAREVAEGWLATEFAAALALRLREDMGEEEEASLAM